MANILFIDDDQEVGRFTRDALVEAGHVVDWIRKDSWTKAVEDFEAKAEKAWDMLLLDIQYPTNEWGGIWLFNDLVRKGHRATWQAREIVYTQYLVGNADLDEPTDMQTMLLKVFHDTANIPTKWALQNQNFDRASLLQMIEDIFRA